jgi:transposase
MSAPIDGAAPPGVVFCYADGRGGKHATEFLMGFSGTLQVDGYTGYNALTKPGRNSGPIKLAYCWAHARRKLKEVHDRDASPIAGEGLKRIATFYKIEEAIRGQSVAQRKAARQEQTKPMMEDSRSGSKPRDPASPQNHALARSSVTLQNTWTA